MYLRIVVFFGLSIQTCFSRDFVQEFAGDVDSPSIGLDGLPNILVALVGLSLVGKAFRHSAVLGLTTLAMFVAVVFAMLVFPLLPWALVAAIAIWVVLDIVARR
jgi:hypothetical protein